MNASEPTPPARLGGAPTSSVIAAFLAVYIIWGSTYLAIRFAVTTIPPFLMGALRFLIAGGLLYAWTRWRGVARPTAAEWRSTFIVGGLLLLLGNGCVVWAETRVSSGVTSLLVAMVPLWMGIWEALIGRHTPTRRAWIGLLMGLAGVYILARPSDLAGAVDSWGAAALMFASAAWALGSVLSRRLKMPASSFLATAMEMLAGSFLLFVAALLAGETNGFDWRAVSATSWLCLLYLITFGSLVGFSCYVWILKVSTPVRVSSYAYVNPLVAVFLGWAFANEAFTPRMLSAGALILPAVVLILLFPEKN
jgi:drug/metabolite transporter (DMT)-like permease